MVKSNKGEIVFVSLLGLLMVFLVIWYHLFDDKPISTDVSPKPEHVLDSTASMLPDSSREFLYPNNNNVSRYGSQSGIDISVNPYYDEGYDQGHEDGYNDGLENLRGDSYDDDSSYRGKKRKEYQLGYEEGYEAGFDDGFSDSDLSSEEEE